MDTKYEELRGLSDGGGGRGGLNLSIIRSVSVRMPALDEQMKIADVLWDMDAEIDALVARREKAELVKQGIMQELLSGRVRLV
jgi:type I restriction enzyme S subunit